MNTTLHNFADDIFSIKVQPRKLRTYRAIWPCGSTWEFDRFDLALPEFRDGEQTGAEYDFDTLRDARAFLESKGCKIENA